MKVPKISKKEEMTTPRAKVKTNQVATKTTVMVATSVATLMSTQTGKRMLPTSITLSLQKARTTGMM